MSQTYFNWDPDWVDGLALTDIQEPPLVGLDLDLTAYIKVDMHETEACPRKALLRARKQFAEISKCKPKFRRVHVIGEKLIMLFTSRQIEYTIEVVTDDGSVAEYYNNIRRENADHQ